MWRARKKWKGRDKESESVFVARESVGWMNAWMDEWMDGWMDGWMDSASV